MSVASVSFKKLWICTCIVLIQLLFYCHSEMTLHPAKDLSDLNRIFIGDQQLPMQHISSPIHQCCPISTGQEPILLNTVIVIGVARMQLDATDSFWDASSRSFFSKLFNMIIQNPFSVSQSSTQYGSSSIYWNSFCIYLLRNC